MEYRLYNGSTFKYHLLWDNGTKAVIKNTIKECFTDHLTAYVRGNMWYDRDPICIVESFEDLEERYPELLI